MKARSKHLRAAIAALVSGILSLEPALLCASEGNLWAERRKAMTAPQRAADPESDPGTTLLASLPTVVNPVATGTGIKNTAVALARLDLRGVVPDWVQTAVAPFATIQSAKLTAGANRPTIVLVQDAHLHNEAQHHIGGVIESLAKETEAKGGRLLVGLEGAAAGPIDLSGYRSDEPDLMKEIAWAFEEANILSGAEAAAISNAGTPGKPGAIDLVGAEDFSLYKANVAALREAVPFEKSARAALSDLRRELVELKKKQFDEALLKFDARKNAYEEGSLSLPDYAVYLDSVVTAEAPNLRELIEAALMEGALKFDRVETERKKLLADLIPKLSEAELKALLQASVLFRAGQVTYAAYYDQIKSLCARHGLALARFPEMNVYIQYVLKSEAIDHRRLFEEIRDLEDAVRRHLASNDQQRAVLALDNDYHLLVKLVDRAMIESEWHVYESRHLEIVNLLDRLAAAGGGKPQTLVDMAPKWQTFDDFYAAALKRNEAMTSNFAAAIDKAGAHTAVIVAGGFHSEGLANLFEKKNLNVLVLSPKITKASDGPSSLEFLATGRLPLDEIFSGQKLFLPTPMATALEGPVVNGKATEGPREGLPRLLQATREVAADTRPGAGAAGPQTVKVGSEEIEVSRGNEASRSGPGRFVLTLRNAVVVISQRTGSAVSGFLGGLLSRARGAFGSLANASPVATSAAGVSPASDAGRDGIAAMGWKRARVVFGVAVAVALFTTIALNGGATFSFGGKFAVIAVTVFVSLLAGVYGMLRAGKNARAPQLGIAGIGVALLGVSTAFLGSGALFAFAVSSVLALAMTAMFVISEEGGHFDRAMADLNKEAERRFGAEDSAEKTAFLNANRPDFSFRKLAVTGVDETNLAILFAGQRDFFLSTATLFTLALGLVGFAHGGDIFLRLAGLGLGALAGVVIAGMMTYRNGEFQTVLTGIREGGNDLSVIGLRSSPALSRLLNILTSRVPTAGVAIAISGAAIGAAAVAAFGTLSAGAVVLGILAGIAGLAAVIGAGYGIYVGGNALLDRVVGEWLPTAWIGVTAMGALGFGVGAFIVSFLLPMALPVILGGLLMALVGVALVADRYDPAKFQIPYDRESQVFTAGFAVGAVITGALAGLSALMVWPVLAQVLLATTVITVLLSIGSYFVDRLIVAREKAAEAARQTFKPNVKAVNVDVQAFYERLNDVKKARRSDRSRTLADNDLPETVEEAISFYLAAAAMVPLAPTLVADAVNRLRKSDRVNKDPEWKAMHVEFARAFNRSRSFEETVRALAATKLSNAQKTAILAARALAGSLDPDTVALARLILSGKAPRAVARSPLGIVLAQLRVGVRIKGDIVNASIAEIIVARDLTEKTAAATKSRLGDAKRKLDSDQPLRQSQEDALAADTSRAGRERLARYFADLGDETLRDVAFGLYDDLSALIRKGATPYEVSGALTSLLKTMGKAAEKYAERALPDAAGVDNKAARKALARQLLGRFLLAEGTGVGRKSLFNLFAPLVRGTKLERQMAALVDEAKAAADVFGRRPVAAPKEEIAPADETEGPADATVSPEDSRPVRDESPKIETEEEIPMATPVFTDADELQNYGFSEEETGRMSAAQQRDTLVAARALSRFFSAFDGAEDVLAALRAAVVLDASTGIVDRASALLAVLNAVNGLPARYADQVAGEVPALISIINGLVGVVGGKVFVAKAGDAFDAARMDSADAVTGPMLVTGTSYGLSAGARTVKARVRLKAVAVPAAKEPAKAPPAVDVVPPAPDLRVEKIDASWSVGQLTPRPTKPTGTPRPLTEETKARLIALGFDAIEVGKLTEQVGKAVITRAQRFGNLLNFLTNAGDALGDLNSQFRRTLMSTTRSNDPELAVELMPLLNQATAILVARGRNAGVAGRFMNEIGAVILDLTKAEGGQLVALWKGTTFDEVPGNVDVTGPTTRAVVTKPTGIGLVVKQVGKNVVIVKPSAVTSAQPAPAVAEAPVAPVAAPAKAEKPVTPAAPVAAPAKAEKPVTPAAPVAAPAKAEKPVTPAAPVAPPAKAEKPVTPAAPVAPPAKAEKPVTPVAPAAKAEKPAAPVAPAKTDKNAKPAAVRPGSTEEINLSEAPSTTPKAAPARDSNLPESVQAALAILNAWAGAVASVNLGWASAAGKLQALVATPQQIEEGIRRGWIVAAANDAQRFGEQTPLRFASLEAELLFRTVVLKQVSTPALQAEIVAQALGIRSNKLSLIEANAALAAFADPAERRMMLQVADLIAQSGNADLERARDAAVAAIVGRGWFPNPVARLKAMRKALDRLAADPQYAATAKEASAAVAAMIEQIREDGGVRDSDDVLESLKELGLPQAKAPRFQEAAFHDNTPELKFMIARKLMGLGMVDLADELAELVVAGRLRTLADALRQNAGVAIRESDLVEHTANILDGLAARFSLFDDDQDTMLTKIAGALGPLLASTDALTHVILRAAGTTVRNSAVKSELKQVIAALQKEMPELPADAFDNVSVVLVEGLGAERFSHVRYSSRSKVIRISEEAIQFNIRRLRVEVNQPLSEDKLRSLAIEHLLAKELAVSVLGLSEEEMRGKIRFVDSGLAVGLAEPLSSSRDLAIAIAKFAREKDVETPAPKGKPTSKSNPMAGWRDNHAAVVGQKPLSEKLKKSVDEMVAKFGNEPAAIARKFPNDPKSQIEAFFAARPGSSRVEWGFFMVRNKNDGTVRVIMDYFRSGTGIGSGKYEGGEIVSFDVRGPEMAKRLLGEDEEIIGEGHTHPTYTSDTVADFSPGDFHHQAGRFVYQVGPRGPEFVQLWSLPVDMIQSETNEGPGLWNPEGWTEHMSRGPDGKRQDTYEYKGTVYRHYFRPFVGKPAGTRRDKELFDYWQGFDRIRAAVDNDKSSIVNRGPAGGAVSSATVEGGQRQREIELVTALTTAQPVLRQMFAALQGRLFVRTGEGRVEFQFNADGQFDQANLARILATPEALEMFKGLGITNPDFVGLLQNAVAAKTRDGGTVNLTDPNNFNIGDLSAIERILELLTNDRATGPGLMSTLSTPQGLLAKLKEFQKFAKSNSALLSDAGKASAASRADQAIAALEKALAEAPANRFDAGAPALTLNIGRRTISIGFMTEAESAAFNNDLKLTQAMIDTLKNRALGQSTGVKPGRTVIYSSRQLALDQINATLAMVATVYQLVGDQMKAAAIVAIQA